MRAVVPPSGRYAGVDGWLRLWLRVAAFAALGLGWPAGARAQALAPERAAAWELNLHAATLLDNLFESSGQSLQAGARVVRQTASGFAFGGNFDWVRTADVVVGPDLDGLSANLYLYSVEVDYAFPVSPRADFFVGGGIGGATVQLNDSGPTSSFLAESSTGQLIPVAAGFKLRNRPVDPSWAFRVDVRDNIILLTTLDGSGEESNEPRNNWELSAGFSFLFGSEPGVRRPEPPARRPAGQPAREPERPRDDDGDGVLDARDQCPATPAGTVVNSFGCPLPDRDRVPETPQPAPEDTDRDGVPDASDRCVNTAAGMRVDERGCPVAVDADGDGVVGRNDLCPGTPAGVQVDATGCLVPEPQPEEPTPEAPVPGAPQPAPEDTDRDGIPDASDRCVNTPAGARVDERGCPVGEDVDGDGVVGRSDRCPGTAPGAAVDATGCPIAAPEAQPEEPAPAAGEPTACVDARDWFLAGTPIEFDDRRWEPLGGPEPITRENLVQIGVHDGVPVYAGKVAAEPYADLWLPRCEADTYQLYVGEGSE